MRNLFTNFAICFLCFVLGFSLAKSFREAPNSAVQITTNNASARILLMDTNGSEFGNIEIKPGRSVDWHGIDQISMLAFTTNHTDESVFIHDWKRTNFGIRIWPGRN